MSLVKRRKETKMTDNIKLNIKKNEMDDEMLELFTISSTGRRMLWTVCHCDLICEKSDWQDRIEDGDTISFELVEI